MGQSKFKRALALLCLTLGVAAPAAAQDVSTSFAQLQHLVAPGDFLSVSDGAGHQIKGRLAAVSADSLDLVIERSRPASTAQSGQATAVTSIQQVHLLAPQVRLARRQNPDSIWNGGVIGAAIAGGPGFLLLLLKSGGSDDVRAVATRMVPALALAGFAAGATLDAAHASWLTIYRSPGSNGPRAWLRPVVSPSTAGAQLSFRY
jgi:hypothetical protein